MSTLATFGDVLDAVDRLPEEQQVDLLDALHRRLAARRRARIVADAKAGLAAFEAGQLRPATVDEIMRDVRS